MWVIVKKGNEYQGKGYLVNHPHHSSLKYGTLIEYAEGTNTQKPVFKGFDETDIITEEQMLEPEFKGILRTTPNEYLENEMQLFGDEDEELLEIINEMGRLYSIDDELWNEKMKGFEAESFKADGIDALRTRMKILKDELDERKKDLQDKHDSDIAKFGKALGDKKLRDRIKATEKKILKIQAKIDAKFKLSDRDKSVLKRVRGNDPTGDTASESNYRFDHRYSGSATQRRMARRRAEESFDAEDMITVKEIDWETDGEEIDLPTTMEVPSDLEEDEIADYLSDQKGWLVNGFVMGAESFEAEIQGCCLCGDSTDLVGCENRKCDELICKACIIDPSEEVLCPSCAYSAESFEADDTKEDSLKYSYGGFQSEEVSQEVNEVAYAEGVPKLQDAEAGIDAQFIQKKDEFMSVLVDDGTLYKLMPDLPVIVEISSSPLAGYNNLRFNFVENPDMEQKILSYAYTIADNSEEEDKKPEYRAGDVRNRLFNVEFDDWAEQEMLTHGGDVSFKEWADEESDSHGDEEFIEWADHEEESHDERYGAEDFTMQEDARYELGDNIVALSTTLKRLMHQDNTGNWDWQNVKKIGKGIKQGDFDRVKGHMDDIDIKTRRVLWDEYHDGLLQLFSNKQLHALAIPWVTDGYGAEENPFSSAWGKDEDYWQNIFGLQMQDWLEFAWDNKDNPKFKTYQGERLVTQVGGKSYIGSQKGVDRANKPKGLKMQNVINTNDLYKSWKEQSPVIQATPRKLCLVSYDEAVPEMHIFLDYMKDNKGMMQQLEEHMGWEKKAKKEREQRRERMLEEIRNLSDTYPELEIMFKDAEISEENLEELENKFHKTIASYTKGYKYTKCSSCEAENKIDSLEDEDGKILHYYYSCECGHNDIQDSPYGNNWREYYDVHGTMVGDDGRCVRCGSDAGFDFEGGCFTCLDVASQELSLNAEEKRCKDCGETYEDCDFFKEPSCERLEGVELSHNEKATRIIENIQQNLKTPDAVKYYYEIFYGYPPAEDYEGDMALEVIEGVSQNLNGKEFVDYMYGEMYGAESFGAEDSFFNDDLQAALSRMRDEVHQINQTNFDTKGKGDTFYGGRMFELGANNRPSKIDVELNIDEGEKDWQYGFVEYAYGLDNYKLADKLSEDSKRKNSGLKNIRRGIIRYYPPKEYEGSSYETLDSYNWNIPAINEDCPVIEIIYPNDKLGGNYGKRKNNVLIRPTVDWELEHGEAQNEWKYDEVYGAESFNAEGDYEPSFDSLEERIEWMEFAVNDKFLHQYEDDYSNVVLDIEEWNENNGNNSKLSNLVKQYKNKTGWMDAESFAADGKTKRKKCKRPYCTKPLIVDFNGYCSQICESKEKPDWMAAESFANYQLLAEEAGGVFLIENNKGFNIEFENGYQVSVKFGAGHYSDNYEKSPIIEMGRYLESSTAEVAILRNGFLIPLDEEGQQKVKGWVPTSLIPPLLTAASEGDEEKIRSIIKEYEKSQQRAEEELGKDSCCCGATVENPCLCMEEGVMNCSAVEPKCPCYAAKDAEAFEAERKLCNNCHKQRLTASATYRGKTICATCDRLMGEKKAKSFEATSVSVNEEMILDYLENSHLTIRKYNGPYKYTLNGLKEHFGVARSTISNIIRPMKSEGLIKEVKRRLEDSPTDYGRDKPVSIYYLGNKEIRAAESDVFPTNEEILEYLKNSHRTIVKYHAPYKYSTNGIAREFEVSKSWMRNKLRELRLAGLIDSVSRRTEDAPKEENRKSKKDIFKLADKNIKYQKWVAEEGGEFIGRMPKNLTMGEKFNIKKNNLRIIFEEAQRPLYPSEIVGLYEQKKRTPKRNKKSTRRITHTKGGISTRAISRIVKSRPDIFYISRSGLIHYVGGGSMKEYIRDLDPKYFAEEEKNKLPSEESIMDYLQYSHEFITKYSAPFKYTSWGMSQKYGVSPVSMRAQLRRMENKGLLNSVQRHCDDLPDVRPVGGKKRLKIYYHRGTHYN